MCRRRSFGSRRRSISPGSSSSSSTPTSWLRSSLSMSAIVACVSLDALGEQRQHAVLVEAEAPRSNSSTRVSLIASPTRASRNAVLASSSRAGRRQLQLWTVGAFTGISVARLIVVSVHRRTDSTIGAAHEFPRFPETLVRPGGDRRRPVHGRPRRRDRERRAAVDQDRPPLQPGEPPVGDHRLLDPLRRRAPARRPAGRPARAPAPLHGRPRALHGQLAARRARLVGGLADRLPLAAGARRRTALAGRALDPDDDVPRKAASATSRSASGARPPAAAARPACCSAAR